MSEKYSNECLRDMAVMTLKQINHGENDGLQLIMKISHAMNMHPNLVVHKIQELARQQI